MITQRTLSRALAWAAIAGQALVTLAWLIAGMLQGGGYSVAEHDISDLGAMTADRPWLILIAQAVSGVLTMAFAVLALRPALAAPGHHGPVSAWLVALSAAGLDDLSDAFFRLDCRAADLGCTEMVATTSWHGAIHGIVGSITFAILVLAPFALARRMRLVPAWRSLAWPAFGYGVLLLVAVALFVALSISTGGGYAQRAVALLGSTGVVVLALRVLALDREHDQF
ncbi:MAG TPA: DUF998 domain-containing protein [Kineosporiaceae bacterium]|nr:DUF998 domain-containing protein [Kineosporiaceae bacterium]